MLFDLRSRRRRNAVKIVYGGLALLIGLGLVGFGIGTGFNFGGIFNAAANGGGGSGTGDVRIEKALTKAQRQATAHPSSPDAWSALGQAAYAVAVLPSNYVSGQGYTKTGFATLGTVRKAWKRYLALAPAHPSKVFAGEVVTAFGQAPAGIQDWATAESAQEVITQLNPNPTASDYEYLAYFAYLAKEISRGDLAASRAIALAPKGQRNQIATALENIKVSVLGATGASGATGTTSSTSSTSSTTSTSRSTSSTHTTG